MMLAMLAEIVPENYCSRRKRNKLLGSTTHFASFASWLLLAAEGALTLALAG